jgi:ankyrin repeat protein
MSLSANEQVERAKLRFLDDKELFNKMSSSKELQVLCDNAFWGIKIKDKFGADLSNYKVEDYRGLYGDLIHMKDKEILQFAAGEGILELIVPIMTKSPIRYTDGWDFRLGYGKFGINIDGWDDALRVASGKGFLNIVEFLIKNGAEDYSALQISLEWASMDGHIDIVKFLYQNIEKFGILESNYFVKSLLSASMCGHLVVVQFFLPNSSNDRFFTIKDINEALVWAANGGHLEVVKYLTEEILERKYNAEFQYLDGDIITTPLIEAVAMDKFFVVEYVIERAYKRKDNDLFYQTFHVCNDESFIIAASMGRLEILRYLIKREAPIKKDDPSYYSKKKRCFTTWREPAFIESASSGHLDVLQFLLTEFSNASEITCEVIKSAFVEAAYCGHLEVLQFLLIGAMAKIHNIKVEMLNEALIKANIFKESKIIEFIEAELSKCLESG